MPATPHTYPVRTHWRRASSWRVVVGVSRHQPASASSTNSASSADRAIKPPPLPDPLRFIPRGGWSACREVSHRLNLLWKHGHIKVGLVLWLVGWMVMSPESRTRTSQVNCGDAMTHLTAPPGRSAAVGCLV